MNVTTGSSTTAGGSLTLSIQTSMLAISRIETVWCDAKNLCRALQYKKRVPNGGVNGYSSTRDLIKLLVWSILRATQAIRTS